MGSIEYFFHKDFRITPTHLLWAALYFCIAKIGKSTSLPQLYANGGRLILYIIATYLDRWIHLLRN